MKPALLTLILVCVLVTIFYMSWKIDKNEDFHIINEDGSITICSISYKSIRADMRKRVVGVSLGGVMLARA